MNELQTTTIATDKEIIRMLTLVNTYYDFHPSQTQLDLYLEAMTRNGDLTSEAVKYIYNQATLSTEICNAARYKAPITPPLLLNLLKNTVHDVASDYKTFTHAEVLAYCDRNATTMEKSFVHLNGQKTKDGQALWRKR